MNKYGYVNSKRILVGVGVAKCLIDEYNSTDILNIGITDEIFNNWQKYIYQDGEIILDPEYDAKQIQARQEAFNKAFFATSLGYIRREVTMLDGSAKTFLTDMLPLLIVGLPILAYNEPDFTQEVNMVDYQKQVVVTEQFLAECKNQLIIDFYGFNPMEISSGSDEPIDGSDTVVDTNSETPSSEVEGEVAE